MRNINGMPKKLFEECVGIVIMQTVQMGFLLSGTTGCGILMKKTKDGTGWSPPCGVGMSGLGFGLLIGASASDLFIFIMDDQTLDAMLTKHGAKLGSQFEATVGPFGRAGFSNFEISHGGWGPTFTIAYSKGAFAGIALQGAKVGSRDFVNNKFYSQVADPKDIVAGKVAPPSGKTTMIQEVYDKLNLCLKGGTAEPTSEEEDKKKAAKEVAMKEDEAVQNSPEVVQVDAAAEAAKETSS